MGEVEIGSEEIEMRILSEKGQRNKRKYDMEDTENCAVKKGKGSDNCSSSNGVNVRWEQLFTRTVFRVLLVEADDSTRQVIAALLRKCCYKVVAVADGLKAWEMLRARPCNIDLILTEVDLPSISGYALLTLVMEHEICKNIPVIMMSSHDSLSTVYKCMLRGAADYLVKPIRRNELRNLWQHVWRRQSSLDRLNSPHYESAGQEKIEGTSENNAASNHSIGDMNKKEFIEKGSDAQSSCTKPDAESEENTQDTLRPVWGNLSPNDIRMQKDEEQIDYVQKLVLPDGLAVALSKDTNRMVLDEDMDPEIRRISAKIAFEACDNSDVPVNSSREAIDFMGTSASYNFSSDNSISNFEFSPHLDLCLRGSDSRSYEIQNGAERCTLRQSNASAFTRYTSRTLQPVHSTMANISDQKELRANSERKFLTNLSGCDSDTPGPSPSSERSIITLANGQTGDSEPAIPSPQQRILPIKVPVNGVSFNNVCTSYGSLFPPITGAPPTLSQSSGNQLELNSKLNPFGQSNFQSNFENPYILFGTTGNDSANPPLQKQGHMFEYLEDQDRISPATDQSATSSLCNGGASNLNMGYGRTMGSNSNVESKSEEAVLHNSSIQRSLQREAALSKFRLKRKERCYEKKVRYESRKKLAEQRPRVKGQFVRQGQIQAAEMEQRHQNAIDG